MVLTRITKITILFLFLTGIVFAQSDSTKTLAAPPDSAFKMHKNPWIALGLSAVAPGAGQIYNESYWKAPVVWGVTGWFVYNFVKNQNSYKENNDKYIQSGFNDRYKKLRDFYRDQRDEFGVYLGITYVLTLVDAYVDAHMFDFTVEETPLGRTSQLHFHLAF
ncbi:MAG: DUF5683 domain-containing protein [Ignavibacteria bacterium]|nr:DUF5683 domain-containing protein [Ignavibacteria bacterium]